MTSRTPILAAAALLSLVGTAGAETIKPVQGGSVRLGDPSGVAYYSAEPKGYRIVVTLARSEAARSVRFETVLTAGQSVTLSTPQELGSSAEAVEISSEGDTVIVSQPRLQGPGREAAALN